MEDKTSLNLREFQAEVLSWHLEHFECFPEHALQKASVELGELQSLDLDRQFDQGGISGRVKIAHEIADVMISLTAYAGRLGISIEGSLWDKWETVKSRSTERVARPSSGDTPEQWLPSASDQELDAER